MTKKWVEEVVQSLKGLVDEERREWAKGYYPSQEQVLGVKTPDIKLVTKALYQEVKGNPPADQLALAYALLDTQIFECRQVAYELISRQPSVLKALDRTALLRLGKGVDNWVSVDTFGGLLLGGAWREGQVKDDFIQHLIDSEDRWLRRLALVATIAWNQKARGGKGNAEKTLWVCKQLISDRDDMVVKALSWALRELAKRDHGSVATFLNQHEAELAPRVRREVRTKLETGRKNG
jgi:3-methyladenine DNA glycosylase AlkD